MFATRSLSFLLTAALSTAFGSLTPRSDGENTVSQACSAISSAISPESSVYYPGTAEYERDIHHWASSSTQHSVCTVEPATAEDVGKILQIVFKLGVEFGVKSGGHIANPGFSSSPGVLIATSRFNQVQYNSESQTAVIGTGLIFDEVYAALAPYNVSVCGGRVTGIGVGGFVLGGGYSWKANQHGLAVDTVVAFELVKPDGSVATVTEESDAELFFGLKGSHNNFGIVTRITMKAFPQTSVWGGPVTYLAPSIADVSVAVAKFSTSNNDPKANIVATYDCAATVPVAIVFLYYDEPSPPQGLFDDFFKIPALHKDVHERSLSSFIHSTYTSNATAGTRGAFHSVPVVEFSENVLRVLAEEAHNWCLQNLPATGPFVAYGIEPYMPNMLSNGKLASAYPPTREKTFSMTNIYFGWLDQAHDKQLLDNVKQSTTRIRDAVIADGQDITSAPLYPNAALADTPLEQMYGGNVDRLRALRARVDPENVMRLAGGFRF
ncbi:FAD dependent oxidoreductase [Amanita muscaria]